MAGRITSVSALADGGVEPVEHPHVLVVEVDVHVAVELAVGSEELRLGLRVGRGERAQHLADVAAVGVDLLLAAGRRAQDRGDANRGHGRRGAYPAAAQNAS